MSSRLAGKTAIVTGASRGIGRAIAARYASEGAKVVCVCHKSVELAKRAVESILACGGEAVAIQADVSCRTDLQRVAVETQGLYGGVDILCANAGIFPRSRLDEVTEAEWDEVQAVNLKGVFLSVQACLPSMRLRGKGRIVVISSTTGPRTGCIGSSHYAASKAGVNGFVRNASLELAAYGITINAIEPGLILTEGLRETVSESGLLALAREIPLRRLGDVADVANTALFFASDESAYITGQTLTVDGGLVLPELPLRFFD